MRRRGAAVPLPGRTHVRDFVSTSLVRVVCTAGYPHRSGRVVRVACYVEPVLGSRSAGRVPDADWTPAMETRLGTAPDEVLAREWGKPVAVVRTRRRVLRIPPFRRPRWAG